MRIPRVVASIVTALFLLTKADGAQSPTLANTGYVTKEAGRIYVVEGNRTARLTRPMALTRELTVLTNGVIKVTGDGTEELTEGRKLSLDGYWIGEDGTLFAFKPHYLFKDRMLYFVKRGVLTRLEENVTLSNGAIIQTDETFLTPGQRLLRLQDGNMITEYGEIIPALDYVSIVGGKLVLQKDGSIIPLPVVSTIGMSDGTRVTGNGMVTLVNGEQLMLTEGQRLTVEGSVMPDIR